MVVQSPQSLQSSVPSPKNGIKIHAETTGERRVSARLQAAKQKANDKMKKRKLELLDEDDGSRPKKRNARAQNQDRKRNLKRKRKREPEHAQTGNEQQQQPEMTSSSVSSVLVEPKMNKKVAKMVERAAKIAEGLDGNNAANFAEKSAHIKVKETLRLFNKHYLHFVQEEEKRCGPPGTDKKAKEARKKLQQANGAEDDGKTKAKRPDLKAMGKMAERNEVLHPESRIGNIPGIDVGFRFYSRAEMVVIGFHNHWLNGIDYIGGAHRKEVYKNYKFPLAVAIVISGMYEDDLDNADDVVYTGQGGHNLNGNKRQIKDQVLLRGNLALKNSMDLGVTVRVVRGHFCESSYTGKVYTYDGLYKVDKYWAEKGLSGFTVYKYLLKRLEGQPTLTTNQVQFTHGRVPQCSSEIRGLVCEDISGGLEGVPVPATNLVDDPPVPPTGYRYCKSMEVARNIKLPANAAGCNCEGECWDPKTCACARLNGSNFPYVHRDGGRLIEAKHVVFECGPNCVCGPRCVNRTSQRGLKYRLEVFRTPKKGWAVRSWNFIPAGAPVCEYIGVLKRTEEMDSVSENNYIFDIDCLQTMRGVGGRDRRQQDASLPMIQNMDKIDEQRSDSVPEFCIDAASIGSVARFINHSCEPNLFIQCVLSEHQDIKLARVMLFAADNIPPLQELTYDYGYALDSVHGPDGKVKQMACYCGAEGCRKRLF